MRWQLLEDVDAAAQLLPRFIRVEDIVLQLGNARTVVDRDAAKARSVSLSSTLFRRTSMPSNDSPTLLHSVPSSPVVTSIGSMISGGSSSECEIGIEVREEYHSFSRATTSTSGRCTACTHGVM